MNNENSHINWELRLQQLAEENPDAANELGGALRKALREKERNRFNHDLAVAHGRARESVVTGVSMSIKCCDLLLTAKASLSDKEYSTLLRITSISDDAANAYIQLATACPELRKICSRRKGRISETEALNLLNGRQTDQKVNPLHNLATISTTIYGRK